MKIEQMELKIAGFLRYGVMFAGATIALGWLLMFKNSPTVFSDFKTYDQIPLQNFLIYHYNQGNWGQVLSYLGLSLLILLPLIRVLFTGFLFIRQKEYLLALIAGLVLLGLILSFTFGIEI